MVQIEVGPKNYADWIGRARHCRNVLFKGLDLRPDDWKLAEFGQAGSPDEGCVFIDCKLGPKMRDLAHLHYGTVYPELAGRPYHVYRDSLYTPGELFQVFDPGDPASLGRCTDTLVYRKFKEKAGADELVARRLHDHFVGEELAEFLAGQKVVAFMGGHDARRDSDVYRETAGMARELARAGYLVATGGGPGLMEAANLGAYFAPAADEDLDTALGILSGAPKFTVEEVFAWLSAAWAVRAQYPTGGPTLGVPTWFYGHEPPNIFSTAIAKYFENSFREEGLLAIATHGVIFSQGNAGTVQEIFQDACQNYYTTYSHRSPMVLFGEEYWNPKPDENGEYPGKSKPAWPLLKKLAQEKGFADLVSVTSSPAEAVARLLTFRP